MVLEVEGSGERITLVSKTLGRPKIIKKRQKLHSAFLSSSLDDINREVRVEQDKHRKNTKMWHSFAEFKRAGAEECFQKYKGRCVYCDKALSYLGRKAPNSARLMFYVPLNVGGKVTLDNLIVACVPCKQEYTSLRKVREDVLGLDSFGDTCEALFKAVRDGANEETILKLKCRINHRLTDIATCMRYVTTSDWIPNAMRLVIEGENTIGDRLEDMAKGEDVKDEITQDVKQIVTSKQYKIIRKQGNEETV